MLCQFTFRNFKSYKNETILDLQAVNGQNFQEALLSSPNDKNEFLPVSVIYGPNAGGKSNVLSALNSVISLVMKPVLMFENKLIQYETVELTPFPTDFEIYFRPNNDYEYKYSISITNGKIEEENLYRRKLGKGGRITVIFERSSNRITLGASINKKNINLDVNEQMPYLSFLYIN